MKKFAVFDIDGTLFRWQLYSEVVFELIESGHISKAAHEAINEKMRLWRERTHRHSFHDYEMATVEAFVGHVKSLRPEDIEAAADAVLARSGAHVYAYTRDLIKNLRQNGYTLIAISGSQDEIVKRFAQLWQFDIALGQEQVIENGVYSGIRIPLHELVVMRKGEILKRLVDEYDLSWEDSYAIGDSRSDAAMLTLVENPIAFNPNDELYEIAEKAGWKIVIERKNMSYELEKDANGTYVLAAAEPR